MALPLAAIGFGLDAISGLAKSGLGLYQLLRARKLNPQRPTYEIPTEIFDALGQSQANLNARAAGAAQAQRNIFRSQANTVNAFQRGATSSQQLLSLVGAAQGQANNAITNLQANEAVDYQRRLQSLNRVRQLMAGYKDQAFQYNKMQPYLDEAATKAALTNAGLVNLFGGVGSTGKSIGLGSMFGAFNGMLAGQGRPLSLAQIAAQQGITDTNFTGTNGVGYSAGGVLPPMGYDEIVNQTNPLLQIYSGQLNLGQLIGF